MGWNNLSASACRLPLVLVVMARVAVTQPQTQAEVKPAGRIEVSSIKPSKPGAVVQDARASFSPGRFEALNITLSEVLDAWSNYTGRVEGGPKWAQSDRYDIVAKSDGVIAPMERRQAVLALLQERFKLVIHQEPRDEAGLALTIEKKVPNLIASKEGEWTIVTSDAHKTVFQAVYMARFVNTFARCCTPRS
jgi:uncharacterized protein (TIGR03435 family)